jgi:Ca-activated chloride channel family protein
MFEFSYPWLFILLPLPLLLRRKTQQQGSPLKHKALLQASSQGSALVSKAPRSVKTVMALLCWCFLVLAATQPKWLGETVTLPQQGRDLMLALDLSGSMDISDMQHQGQSINRLQAVKLVVSDFIQQRKGDRIGLILFGDAAYQQTPLTYDLTTIQTMLDEAVRGLVGERTAIGEAIGLAVKRLNAYETSNKVLILLSDGANTAGVIQPTEALQLAKAAGVKVYTVGVGAEQMVQQSIFGRQLINPSQDLDEVLLTRIAEETGGKYFRARDLAELAQIYKLLDQLEPIERDQISYRPQQSLLHWPLLAAFFCSVLLALGQVRWSGRIKHVG